MYSNVTPPALPEWNTSAYPYYVLVFTYGKGDTDWHSCALYYMAAPFVYNDGGYVTGTAETFGYRGYKTSTGTWEYWLNGEEFQQPGTALELRPGVVGGNYQRIYTSHDIKDSAGNTWLADGSITGAVETVTECWLRSFQTGLALGLCGSALDIHSAPPAYIWDEESGMLIVNRDEGSLIYDFNRNTFHLNVTQQY